MKPNDLIPLVSRIRLDFRSGVPIYTQIMKEIEQLVSGGILQVGDQLPTVRALAQELRVNFNTVARAYRLLDEAGIISTQQGRGTYILETKASEKPDEEREQALQSLSLRYLQDVLRLGYQPDQIIEVLEKQITDWRQSEDK
ncbi:MAG: GntR family transcriptional regulator [Anaerolineae bacterium]|jgi:GntR family transcriptional regulator|nr:GntR family transcriptional regulator [Anaerolineae bacterium]MBT7070504.1 GntR family transcriptional regulator [Anaerolineae bacterium]MBT7325764.1 GntR family transcriptional regulator [Anaerolineae bacterium]